MASAAALRQHFASPATAVLLAIEQFFSKAKQPALLEPGEPLLSLTTGNYTFQVRSSHVLLQAWNDTHSLARKIVAAGLRPDGRLCLTAQLFGNREGKLELLDLASPRRQDWQRRGTKLLFRERFRQFLTRQYPDWRIAELSTDPNLEHSLSPTFPRALLVRGNRAVAAIGGSQQNPESLLTFGLIWHDYLRRRDPKLPVERLILLAPAGAERLTAQRLNYLTLATELYAYSENDHCERVDCGDRGNLDSALQSCRKVPGCALPLEALAEVPGFSATESPDGSASLRIHGLEFARLPTGRPSAELERHARLLSGLREEKGGLLFRKDPERWLEAQVRRDLGTVDASLLTAPVYGQVPAFTAADRGIVDLLALDHSGRLAVLELKASADIHLPLQALDYYIRVKHHAERGEFSANGYFHGRQISAQSPRLILVAPALDFHSSTETVLSYFSPEIETQRIGLAGNWRERLRVMFRLNGAECPP